MSKRLSEWAGSIHGHVKSAMLALARQGCISPFPQHPERALPEGLEFIGVMWVGCSPEWAVRRLGTVCHGKKHLGRQSGFGITGPSGGGDPGCCRSLTPPEKSPGVEREFLAEAAGISAVNIQELLQRDFLKSTREGGSHCTAAEFQLP